MASSSGLFVAATGAVDKLAESCGWILGHLALWEMAALLALFAVLAGVVCAAYSNGVGWKRRLGGAAPILLIALPVCAFAVAHAADWLGACNIPAPYIAALAYAGAAWSGIMLGVCWDVYGASKNKPFQYTVLVSVMATTAFAYNMLQVAGSWGSDSNAVAQQFFAAIAMVATAVGVAIFGVEYGKNRGQYPRRYWLLPIALFVAGVMAYSVPSGADVWPGGDGGDIQWYIVQTMWAGVTVAGTMLGARIVAFLVEIAAKRQAAGLPAKSLRLWLTLTAALAVLGPSYYAISDEWVCLTTVTKCADPPGPIVSMYALAGLLGDDKYFRPWVFVTALLVVWNVMMALVAAMLGATMSTRMLKRTS